MTTSAQPPKRSAKDLRQQAVAQLKKQSGGNKFIPSEDDANRMLHELQVHHLELEMQNEELQQARIVERKSAQRYTALFEFAPIGYFALDMSGTISQVNLRGASLLGIERANLAGRNFLNYISAQHQEAFKTFLVTTFEHGGIQTCEILVQFVTRELWLSVEANFGNFGNDCLMALIDISPMKEYQKQLEHIAHYDVLTNLPNRSLLADRLSQSMLQCSRHQQSLAVVYLDLDAFKDVNDAHGHVVGDELLIALSLRMKEALREGDTLARIGGDEFVAVLADLAKVEDCEPVLERFLLAASEPVTVDNVVLNVSASIGVTLYPQDYVDADQLMRHADQAMYVAKQAGKNHYHFFDTTQDDAVTVQREKLEAIRSALDNHQFVLHYQPKVNMKKGTVIGVEALIRWQHPDRGLLHPIEFLPFIENSPMSIEMGEWVIDTALTQIGQWQAMGVNLPVSTSVNIAAVQLQQSDFTQKLMTMLAAHPNVAPHYLELEVLETSALDDVQYVSKIMNACKAEGVSFALDDFGTGYSSLTYLRRLPANLIKIDQSFVRHMLVDADDLAIVEVVIALAKSFKRDVIAEGVETIEHGTMLLQLGCNLAQGFGIAKPMPASDIPAWISNWKPDVSWQL